MRYIFILILIIQTLSCGKTNEKNEQVSDNKSSKTSLQDSLKSQVWDTSFTAKLTPGGKDNLVKIHSTFSPETKNQKWTKLNYTVSIDGKEKAGKIGSIGDIRLRVKTIDIDKSDDYEHLLIYYIIDDPVNADLPYYDEYLFIHNETPEIAKVFRGNEPITYGDGFIYYNYNFGFGNIKRKCTIEKNKFRDILEKEYPLEKKDGVVTDSFTLYSTPDIKSSVVKKTSTGEKVSIIGCNLNEYKPDDNDEKGHSVIWFKIKTENGKTGWANKAEGRIKGEGINWAG